MRAHNPSFDQPKIWPNFIFSRVAPPNTFAKLAVRALINKSKKKSYGHQLGPMTHFLMNQKFDPILYFQGSRLNTHLQSFLCVP